MIWRYPHFRKPPCKSHTHVCMEYPQDSPVLWIINCLHLLTKWNACPSWYLDLRWSDGFALHSAFVGAGIRCQTLGRCRLLCWVAAAVAGMVERKRVLSPVSPVKLSTSTCDDPILKMTEKPQNNTKPLFFGYLTMFDHVWPFFRGWGTHLDLFCGSCEDKPRNIFVHESHPLPRPQRMEAAPRGAWDWMDPPKKIQRVSNVSPKPNKTVENILNDGTICNYDFWNCSYVFDSSKSLFYHIISSRHKPIKKHLEVLQVPFCHYRTIVLWQLSQVVSHCIPIFPYIFRVTLWGYLTVIYSWPCTLCIFMYFSGGTSSENGIILGSHNFDPPRSAFKVYLEAQSPAGSWWILQTGVVCSSETAKRLRGSDR